MENKKEYYYNEGTDYRDLPSRKLDSARDFEVNHTFLDKLFGSYNAVDDTDFSDEIPIENLNYAFMFNKDNAYETYHNLIRYFNHDPYLKPLGEELIDLLALVEMEKFYGKSFTMDDVKN